MDYYVKCHIVYVLQGRSPDRLGGLEGKKSKSFDERVDEYERARARIFSQQEVSPQYFFALWNFTECNYIDLEVLCKLLVKVCCGCYHE